MENKENFTETDSQIKNNGSKEKVRILIRIILLIILGICSYIIYGYYVKYSNSLENKNINESTENKDLNYTTDIKQKYKVDFYVDSNSYKVIEVEENSLLKNVIKDIETPKKEGYVFEKWDINEDTKVTENLQINAIFIEADIYNKEYEVTLVYDDFYAETEYWKTSEFNEEQKKYLNDFSYDRSEKIAVEKNKFLGWYYNNELYDWSIPKEDKITLVAKYEKTTDDYLKEYENLETNNITAELIYELNKKIIGDNSMCIRNTSEKYYNMIGKMDDFPFEHKIPLFKIRNNISCNGQNEDGTFGCYIPRDSVEKLYKNIYGNNSKFNINVDFGETHPMLTMPVYDSTRDKYFIFEWAFGTCGQLEDVKEKIVNVEQIGDTIELTKKAIFKEKFLDETPKYYDYEGYYTSKDKKELTGGTTVEELKDKLTSYIFVFKKDTTDNYYLYEVKKELPNN